LTVVVLCICDVPGENKYTFFTRKIPQNLPGNTRISITGKSPGKLCNPENFKVNFSGFSGKIPSVAPNFVPYILSVPIRLHHIYPIMLYDRVPAV